MTTAVGREPRLRIGFCRDDEVPALMRFIGEYWRAGHILSRDEALLRWQFAPERLGISATAGRVGASRAEAGPTVLLAWADESIIGMLGLTGFDFNAAGTLLRAAWMSHWFTVEAHRRQAIPLRLLWAARDCGVSVLATLGANRVADALLGRLGMQRIPALTRWVGVFDPAAAAELVRAASPGALVDPQKLVQKHLVRPSGEADGDIGIVEWNDLLAAPWDRWWLTVLGPRLTGACRDASYLRWRYRTHPRFQYVIRVAQRGNGAIEGLAVWRVEEVRGRSPARVLRIVEFLASPAGAVALADEIAAAGQREAAALADFHCSSPDTAEALVRIGFRPQIVDPTMGGLAFPSRLQPLEPGTHQMLPLVRIPQPHQGALSAMLYMTSSDCDQDRPN